MRVSDVVRIVQTVVKPLRNQVNMMVSRAVLDAVKDGSGFQVIKVVALSGEVLDEIEHYQPAGVSHSALGGAEGIVLCVGGRRAHALGLGFANRDARPTGIEAGETAIWCAGPNGGTKILLKADGDVEITATAKVIVNGDVEASGEVTAKAGNPATLVSLTGHKVGSPFGPLAVIPGS